MDPLIPKLPAWAPSPCGGWRPHSRMFCSVGCHFRSPQLSSLPGVPAWWPWAGCVSLERGREEGGPRPGRLPSVTRQTHAQHRRARLEMERGVKHEQTAAAPAEGLCPRAPTDPAGRSRQQPLLTTQLTFQVPAAWADRHLPESTRRVTRTTASAWHLPRPLRGQRGTSGGHCGGTPTPEQHFPAEACSGCPSGCTALQHGCGPATTWGTSRTQPWEKPLLGR